MNHNIIVIYDKDCYFCSNFQEYLQLKQKYLIEYIDLNANPEIVKYYKEKGYHIQNGIVVDVGGQIYQGEKAIAQIQKLLKPTSFFDGILSFCMKTPWLVAVGYPIASFSRKVLLRRQKSIILGK